MFPCDEERFFYFVREGYQKDVTSYSRFTEGFGRELEYKSELIDGRVFIDGHFTKDLGMGDSFYVDTKPEYCLKCVRFLL